MTLTPKEQEVVKLVARDMYCKDIANALGVCEKTIHVHLSNARRKFGAKTTAGLMLLPSILALIGRAA